MGLDPDKGAVAAGHKATAEAAVEILRAGGNAFDAIVAGLWAACVCEPVLAAPGGGGFLMAHEGGKDTGTARLFDFFCDAPRVRRDPGTIEFAEVLADFGPTVQAFHIGAGAAAVPGFVPGIKAVHSALGSMAMADLIVPAVTLAKGGVTVTPFQAYLFDVVTPILTWTSEARAIFAPGGRLLGAGMRNFWRPSSRRRPGSLSGGGTPAGRTRHRRRDDLAQPAAGHGRRTRRCHAGRLRRRARTALGRAARRLDRPHRQRVAARRRGHS
jgi:gamma-glutamyltranspeptidase